MPENKPRETKGNRRRGRELAFQVLFQMDVGRNALGDVLSGFLVPEKGLPQVKAFARRLAEGAAEDLAAIDAALAAPSKNWDFKRFAPVDRAILRLGAFELMSCPDIPAEVTLDECIELAKEYGGEDSPRFVNGILDQVRIAFPKKAA